MQWVFIIQYSSSSIRLVVNCLCCCHLVDSFQNTTTNVIISLKNCLRYDLKMGSLGLCDTTMDPPDTGCPKSNCRLLPVQQCHWGFWGGYFLPQPDTPCLTGAKLSYITLGSSFSVFWQNAKLNNVPYAISVRVCADPSWLSRPPPLHAGWQPWWQDLDYSTRATGAQTCGTQNNMARKMSTTKLKGNAHNCYVRGRTWWLPPLHSLVRWQKSANVED